MILEAFVGHDGTWLLKWEADELVPGILIENLFGDAGFCPIFLFGFELFAVRRQRPCLKICNSSVWIEAHCKFAEVLFPFGAQNLDYAPCHGTDLSLLRHRRLLLLQQNYGLGGRRIGRKRLAGSCPDPFWGLC